MQRTIIPVGKMYTKFSKFRNFSRQLLWIKLSTLEKADSIQRETHHDVFFLTFSSYNLKDRVGTVVNPWTVLPNFKFRPFRNAAYLKNKKNELWCSVLKTQSTAGGTQRGYDIITRDHPWELYITTGWCEAALQIYQEAAAYRPSHRKRHSVLVSKRPPPTKKTLF